MLLSYFTFLKRLIMNNSRITGFTLIELMIVVAIMGIIASIAYPSYNEYVLRAKRGDAKTALLSVQLAQEKWRANHVTYGSLANIGIASTSPDSHYAIAIPEAAPPPDDTSYLVTATPAPPHSDSSCGTFAVNQDGKFHTDYADSDCWAK